MAAAARPTCTLPLWPLPLVAALLPAVATLLALAAYTSAHGVFCNPFIDDCVSISRMAKQGWANHVFHALVLPGAVLQLATWLVAAGMFADAAAARREAQLIAALGTCAGITLVVYGTFLGSDGAIYAWLRRWGPLLYFGSTYLAMLVFARVARRLHDAGVLPLPRGQARAIHALLGFAAVVALVHGFASATPFAALEDRVENLSEWWGATAMTLVFVVMARLWACWGLCARLSLGGPSR